MKSVEIDGTVSKTCSITTPVSSESGSTTNEDLRPAFDEVSISSRFTSHPVITAARGGSVHVGDGVEFRIRQQKTTCLTNIIQGSIRNFRNKGTVIYENCRTIDAEITVLFRLATSLPVERVSSQGPSHLSLRSGPTPHRFGIYNYRHPRARRCIPPRAHPAGVPGCRDRTGTGRPDARRDHPAVLGRVRQREGGEETLKEDPLVLEIAALTRTPDRILYSVNWSSDIDSLLGIIMDLDVDVLTAEGTANHWEFRLQFADREQLTQFRRACQNEDIPLDLLRVYNQTMPPNEGPLTAEQSDALATAYERGFWNVPREITQKELAKLVGISDNSMSQRLRRGVKVAVEELLYGTEHR